MVYSCNLVLFNVISIYLVNKSTTKKNTEKYKSFEVTLLRYVLCLFHVLLIT